MPFSTVPTSRSDARAQLLAQHDTSVARGDTSPFIYPWGTVGAGIVVLYLLIPQERSPFLRRLRYTVWLLNAIISAYGIFGTGLRTTLGYCGGLISAWAILWTTTLLITHDAQHDFRRVSPITSSSPLQWGTASSLERKNGAIVLKQSDQAQRPTRYCWQPYPASSFGDRIVWVLDLFTQFRGVGWNFQLTALPPLPREIRKQLGEDTKYDTSVGRDGTRRFDTRRGLLAAAFTNFIIGYLALDGLATIAIHDSYFWGLTDSPAPRFLPQIFHESTFLLRSFRNVFTMFAVYAALQTVFALAPLFFVGVLGTRWIGVWGEPWMYPDCWGSFRKVPDFGLLGFWGSWWHQVFRYGFESNATAVVRFLQLSEKKTAGAFLKLFFVFSLSGFLHASGSIASFGNSKPFAGSYLFFVLQPFGITAQMLMTDWLRRNGIADKTPKLVKQLVMFIWTYFWLHFTAPLVCDDFARTGIWMIEPAPVSPLRALGFGEKDDSWWCWRGDWVAWHHGKHWWQTGLAL